MPGRKSTPENMMLTSSMKELEKDGLVNRVQYNEIPPHVECSMAQNGITDKIIP